MNEGVLEIILYRPVGQRELDFVKLADWSYFPPRLKSQPYFYPVLSEEYATQIARDWNTKDSNSGFIGYVLKFKINSEFINNFKIHTVGSSIHKEYWIPSEDLSDFNKNIIGKIELINTFKGK